MITAAIGRAGWRSVLAGVLLAAAVAACTAPARRHLLIVVDGLRPDYVTLETMPYLTGLGRRGIVFTHHHSVYPTVTRVNASSISTGAYPERHGLLGNSVFFPRVDPTKFLDTADRDALLKIGAAEGQLLTAETLGAALQRAGHRLLVVSSGSAGSAFLNNHTVSGGAILHPQYVLPESLREPMGALGPAPSEDAAGSVLDAYAVDALLKVGLPRVDPTVTVLWLGGLDSTAHANGVGHPETVATLRRIDAELQRVEDGLRTAGRLATCDIWVTSDHGFSTNTGGVNLGAILEPFAGTLADGSPRIVNGGGAIYVRNGDAPTVEAIVAALQRTPGVGAIFTPAARAGALDGGTAGTLSFDAVRWSHPRAAQILFSPDWTDAKNAYAMPGTSASSGTAGHGSTSPWDVHNTLIAAGPDIRQGVTSDLPSANVDFAPTFLRLLGLPIPASMQGRPLEEALLGGKDATREQAGAASEHTVATRDGTYAVTARFSHVTVNGREYRYFDGTSGVRRATANVRTTTAGVSRAAER